MSKYAGPSESEIQARIMLELGALPGIRLFRNTVGEGYQGHVVKRTPEFVVLENYRYVTFGLGVGTSDLIGWAHGRFLGIECKTPAGKASPEQMRFISAVLGSGGFAGVARSPDEAFSLISDVSL